MQKSFTTDTDDYYITHSMHVKNNMHCTPPQQPNIYFSIDDR